jgi:hypothetical protein
MAWLPNPIACDVCGVVKQPSNHWWYVDIQVISLNDGDYFTMRSWDDLAEDRSKPFKHICGQACAIRLLNEFMDGGKGEILLKYDPQPTADKRTSNPNPQPASIQQQREGN